MSFVLSKLLWPLLDPRGLTALLLLAGVPLLWTRRARWGRRLVAGAALLVLGFGVLPGGAWLLAPLESRFPPAAEPGRVDGIVVLGGALQPDLFAAHGRPALNDLAERMTAFAGLALRHPQARLVFSGGSGALLAPEMTEAPVARALFAELGLDTGRILFEGASRDTWENAVLSQVLARPQPGERWLLVTSAFHMPRAIGAFRKAGWAVTAYPVDYRVGRGFALDWGLPGRDAALALHEWLGLLAYRLMGRSDALWPSVAAVGESVAEHAEPSPRMIDR